jgi:hypothetical protein
MFFDWRTNGMDWGHGYSIAEFEAKEDADKIAIEFVFESIDNRPAISEYIFFVG